MAFERLGHRRYAVLNGGYGVWQRDGHPEDTLLPRVAASRYPVPREPNGFTADASQTLAASRDGRTVIIDVRPADYYTGARSDEARAGHIPGAVNRPYGDDLIESDGSTVFKPVTELEAAYAALVPDKTVPVIVHCRTGHQGSQTFFVLKYLLGYERVRWYDAGWTEWAARPELPVVPPKENPL
jgi:thiosulfate/3-mercaptopyruvate sulfurtransferase